MDTADPRLTGLALSWLTTRGKKPGTRTELENALRPFVEHRLSRAEWKERCGTLVGELLSGGQVKERGKSALELTADGRAKALRFLGLEQNARGLTWKKLKATHLMALGLGLTPTKAVRERLAKADNVRATLIRRQHPVEGPEDLKLAQVKDRLLWRQLGVETDRPFSMPAVQAHLLGKLLEADTKDPRKAVAQLAARAAGASRVDMEAVRMATLRRWLLPESATAPVSPEPAAEQMPSTGEDFAERVLAAARASPTGRFGHDKVFISHVWKALQPEWSNRAAFDAALLEANRTRRLSLSRADLVSAMDPADVAESEVRSYGARFHFVVV